MACVYTWTSFRSGMKTKRLARRCSAISTTTALTKVITPSDSTTNLKFLLDRVLLTADSQGSRHRVLFCVPERLIFHGKAFLLGKTSKLGESAYYLRIIPGSTALTPALYPRSPLPPPPTRSMPAPLPLPLRTAWPAPAALACSCSRPPDPWARHAPPRST